MSQINIALALQIAFDTLGHVKDLVSLLGTAHAEKRDVTEDELSTLAQTDTIVREQLDTLIESKDDPS